MPNSTAQAQLTISIIDGFSSQTLFNHIVPAVQYSGQPQTSLSQNTTSAYLTLAPSTTVTLLSNPPVSSFLFVRNAGSSGILQLETGSTASPGGPELFVLVPGAVWLFASPSVTTANFLTSAILSVQGEIPATAEYLLGI